jgi:ATP-dependent RNA helicase DHX8/PRP22
MDSLSELQLVSKVTQELNNQIGINDKTLAAFVIEMAIENDNPTMFHNALFEQGAELPRSFVETLMNIIRKAKSKDLPSDKKYSSSEKYSAYSLETYASSESNNLLNFNESISNYSGSNYASIPNCEVYSSLDGHKYLSPPEIRKNLTIQPHLREVKSYSSKQSRIHNFDHNSPTKREISRSWITSDEPKLYSCYRGRVSKVLDYGCFVELLGFQRKHEGLVHTRYITKRKGYSAKDIVKKGIDVWVKIISSSGTRLSMSMCDVDQESGKDLVPIENKHQPNQLGPSIGLKGLSGVKEISINNEQNRRRKKLTSPERFEIQQLVASTVIQADERPYLTQTESSNLDQNSYDDIEEEFEVDLNEDEPEFLKGFAERLGGMVSPPRVVRAPDGSLNRAAMTASALAKERRELKDQQQRSLLDVIPTDLSKPWEDPMAETNDRHLAAELRGMNLTPSESVNLTDTASGKTGRFGKIDTGSIKEQRECLPISAQKNDFINAIMKYQTIIVIGATGSGKTTQMTQYLHESGLSNKGIIACTQPRRVAAQSIAKRVSDELGCRIGEEVGYNVRFDDCTGPNTVIKYMTDGMLLREAVIDSNMSRYSAIILDEAHERTINTDVLFGVLKKVVKSRSDLKLIVTSATLDAEKFSTYFFSSPIFTIKGKMYPVEKFYNRHPENDYMDAALTTIMQIHLTEPDGDILVFLTGQEEIETTSQILHDRMNALGSSVPKLLVLPVYGALPSEIQSQIFEKTPLGTRKCIISTNIAEASITIDGIYYVVDPGMCKMNVFNPKTGMESLIVIPVSQASANQRAGRAGRTGPGKCYRLYTEEAFMYEMLENSVPEIQRCNLGMTVLTLKAMGINDLLNFDFMDPPPESNLIYALETLYNLGAFDEQGLLTKLGRKMAEFPLDPPMSKVLLASVDLGCSDEIITIMSMLQVQNVFYRPRDKQAQADQRRARFFQPEGDHLTLLVAYSSWKEAKLANSWCYENFIQVRALKTALDTRRQLIGIMDRYKLELASARKNYIRIQKAITSGYFSHAARKDPQEGYKSVVEQQPLFIHPSSALFQQQPDWVIYHTSTVTTKEYMREVMAIDPKWLVELAPRFFRSTDHYKLSRRKRCERLEPLYDRYHDPKSWRLSRRRG